MPKFGYSFKEYDPVVHARASGREINMSPKAAREVCNTIKGKKLSSALSLLDDVIDALLINSMQVDILSR